MSGNIGITFTGNSAPLTSELAKAGAAVKDFGETSEKYLQKGALSAKQLAFATRGLPSQFTDIAVSLQAGQSPLTVFLQQGGQLKDMFGGIGPAARAMGGYIAGLVNPITLAATATGTLAVAYYQGASEAEAYNKAILLTGNAAGTTAIELANMAKAVSATTGATVHESAAALAAFAADGNIASGQFQKLSASAIAWQKATGTAVADTLGKFSELGKDPLTASLKLNESTHYLTINLYEQIRALTEQGRTLEAGTLAQNAWSDAINSRAPKIIENLGYIERAWNGVKDAAKLGWDAMLGIGRMEDPTIKIKQRMDAIRQAQSDIYGDNPFLRYQLGDLQKQLDNWEHIKASERDLAEYQRKNNLAMSDQESFDKMHDQYLSKAVRMQNEIVQAVQKYSKVEHNQENLDAYNAIIKGIKDKFKETTNAPISNAITEAEKGLEKYSDLMAKASGFTKSWTDDVNLLRAALDGGKIDQEQFNAAVNALYQMQPSVAAAHALEADAIKKTNKLLKDYADNQHKTIAASYAEVSKAQAAYDAHGKLASVLMEETLAREENIRATMVMAGEDLSVIDAQIANHKKLIDILRKGEDRDANEQSAKAAAAEWQKTNEQIGQSLTDQLMQGGRNAADYLTNLFRTLVLRPVIMAGVGSMTGGMASAAGVNGAGSAGSLLGTASMLSNLYSMVSGGMNVGLQGGAQIAKLVAQGGLLQGSSAVAGFAGGMMSTSSMAAATAAAKAGGAQAAGLVAGSFANGMAGYAIANAISGGYQLGAVNTIAGLASMIPGVGPIAGVVGGLITRAFGHGATELTSSGTRGTFSGSSFSGVNYANYNQEGGWFSSDNNWSDITKMDPAALQAWSDSFASVKASMLGVATALGLATDQVAAYSKAVDIAAGTTAEQLTAIFTGMADDMATAAAPSIAEFAKAGETASATLSRLSGSITTANAWLSMLRNRLYDVSLSGADAASKLADAFGSLDQLAASSKAYYETYYTEAERAQKSTEDMAKAMALVNVALPDTKDQFRAIVDSLDLTTDSGRNAYAVLLQLAPEFATTADAIDKLATDAAAKLMETFTAGGDLLPALDSAALSVGDFTGSTTTLSDEINSINTVMGDASSAVIEFRKGAVTLGEKLSDSQISAGLLADQIALLRDSADGARIDFEGLGAALDGVNTETFVATITKVFESLASRISGVLGDINTERIAVRDAALQIVNPTVMSKEAISRAIAGINTGLPSNAGVVNANTALASADAASEQSNSYWSQRMASANQALADAQSYSAGLATKYTGLSADFIELQKQFGNIFANIKANDGQVRNGLQYDSKTNRISDYTSTYYTWGDWGWSDLAGYNAAASKSSVYRELWAGNDYLIAAENSIKRWQTYVEDVANQAASAAQANATSVSSAQETAKKAAIDYAAALQNFAIDASKSVTKLTKLREETVKYYEQQQQLAELMSTSAGSLRKTISDYNYSQLSPDQQLAVLQGQFSSAYSLAQSTQGDGQTLAGYGDKLNSLLGPLIDKLNETNKTSLIANYLAQAESVATLIDAAMPVNYQQDSLDLLGSIDATLAALDESSRSAEQIIADAVNAGSDRTAAGLRAVGEAISGKTLPAFAAGGYHAGGARLVGEYGPEVEVTGPSTIYTLSQWRAMARNGASNTARLEALVERQAQQLEAMSYELRAIAVATGRTAKTLERVTPDGNSLQTSVAA